MKKLLCAVFALLALEGCRDSGPRTQPDSLTVTGREIQIRPDSKFTEQLRIVSLGQAPGGERRLRTVGQMIAMANPSGELTHHEVSWVVLDPALVSDLGIHLSETAPIGYAYGMTSIAPNYREAIHPGEKVEVYRYGLRQNSAAGVVISVHEDSVVFAISKGQDWYPGTNCEIEFPLIQRQAMALSPLSMLHEGVREFVLKEVGPNRYLPVEITVVNETKDSVYAIGELHPGDRIVERGAILLKPVVHQILRSASPEVSNVR